MNRVGLPVLLVMTAVLVAFFQQSVNSLSDDEKTQITTGLEAGEKIAELLTSKQFTKALTKIGTSLGPYLGVLGPFVGIILSFIPGEDSAELQFLKEMMKKIDTRFDRLDSRFDDVERLIEWSAVQVNFGQIEQKILAMSEEYQLLYQAPPQAVENRKDYFIDVYESDYQNSGYKLYQALISSRGTFQENLGLSVMRYTENDRKKTQDFLLGTMQLLLQAVKIEMAYFQVQGHNANAEYTREIWEGRIMDVKDTFESVDREVNSKWGDQSSSDTDKYAAHNSGMSNKDFSIGLYNMLSTKFYWRDWFVVIYKDLNGGSKHWVGYSGGQAKFRKNGRNIVYNSEDKNAPRMNANTAKQNLQSLNCAYCDAHQYYNSIPSSGATGKGVIEWGADVWYSKSSAKTFSYNTVENPAYGKYNLHLWG